MHTRRGLLQTFFAAPLARINGPAKKEESFNQIGKQYTQGMLHSVVDVWDSENKKLYKNYCYKQL